MKLRAKADGNQKILTAAFRGLGCSVALTHQLGHGFPDAIVGDDGVSHVVEFKMPGEGQTDDQIDWAGEWRGDYWIVRTVEGVVETVKTWRGIK